MSRGLPPGKALEASLPLARLRGQVVFFRQDADAPGNFLIIGPGDFVIVRVRRTRRLFGPLNGVEAEQREVISLLRSMVLIQAISCELWLWCPTGGMRFFRIEEKNIIELDRHGRSITGPGSSFKEVADP